MDNDTVVKSSLSINDTPIGTPIWVSSTLKILHRLSETLYMCGYLFSQRESLTFLHKLVIARSEHGRVFSCSPCEDIALVLLCTSEPSSGKYLSAVTAA